MVFAKSSLTFLLFLSFSLNKNYNKSIRNNVKNYMYVFKIHTNVYKIILNSNKISKL
jgi:hypothetical protein